MGLLDAFQRRRSLQLDEKARKHLQAGELAHALAVAKKLEKLRYSAAFEIAALAHAGRGELELAISTLQRGLALAPTAWINWQLMGTLLSDAGRFDEAAAAYARALECPEAWRDSVQLNRGILANRRGEYDEALTSIERITEPQLRAPALAARLTALHELHRHAQVIEEAEQALRGDETKGEEWGHIAATLLRSRRALGADRELTRAQAIAALDKHHGGSDALLQLIRELRASSLDPVRHYRVTLHVRLPPPLRPNHEAGYYVVCFVRASDQAEAVTLARELEGPDFGLHAQVEKCELLDEREVGESLAGAYRRSGRIFHGQEE